MCLPAGRRGRDSLFSGAGTFPMLVLGSALPHKPMGQVVLAMAMWGPWAGPHAREVSYVFRLTQGGRGPHPQALFLLWISVDGGSAVRAKEK